MRQHAVLEYWPDKFFTYINFVREDLPSLNWEESAARAGLNKADMKNRKILEPVKRLAEAEIHNIMEIGIKSDISIQIFIENRELIIPLRKEDFIQVFDHLKT